MKRETRVCNPGNDFPGVAFSRDSRIPGIGILIPGIPGFPSSSRNFPYNIAIEVNIVSKRETYVVSIFVKV